MKVEYINPFIESVDDLFGTMMGCVAHRGEISLSRSDFASYDIIALIGMSGPARGTVALSFPVKTAMVMVQQLTGMAAEKVDETVLDAMAEIVNIVAGGAKAKLHNDADERPIDLSLPTVIRGKEFTLDNPSYAVWLDVPFTTDLGNFSMRVTFARNGGD